MKCDMHLIASWDEPLETALTALANGFVSLQKLQDAACLRRNKRPVIGRLGLKQGMLSMAQVFRILERQALTGELFGEVAVQFGFLNEVELFKLLQLQANLAPSLSDVLMQQALVTGDQKAQVDEQVRLRLQTRPPLTDTRLSV
jgi:hypothetical protein